MNAYLHTTSKSPALRRIEQMLGRYAPRAYHVVDNPSQAELIVLYAIGRLDHLSRTIYDILDVGKQFAIVQIALRSTRNPLTRDWLDIWSRARLIWTYYDLPFLMAEDGVSVKNFSYYHAPLGADPFVFFKQDRVRKYVVETNGNVTSAECIHECFEAAELSGNMAAHFGLGAGVAFRRNVDYFGEVSDLGLNALHNQCIYVSGLRRKDGFEMASAEGLLCGARPILFDNHNYRQWFDGLARFIPERSSPEVVRSLVDIFNSEVQPVTQDEIDETKRRFNWETIVRGFWERVA